MSITRTALAGLTCIGFQTITLSNSTAQGLNSTLRTARHLRISVETNNVRFREDGTDPTLTTGVLLSSGLIYDWEGYNGTSRLKFQRATGTSKLSILGYTPPGY